MNQSKTPETTLETFFPADFDEGEHVVRAEFAARLAFLKFRGWVITE